MVAQTPLRFPVQIQNLKNRHHAHRLFLPPRPTQHRHHHTPLPLHRYPSHHWRPLRSRLSAPFALLLFSASHFLLVLPSAASLTFLLPHGML